MATGKPPFVEVSKAFVDVFIAVYVITLMNENRYPKHKFYCWRAVKENDVNCFQSQFSLALEILKIH